MRLLQKGRTLARIQWDAPFFRPLEREEKTPLTQEELCLSSFRGGKELLPHKTLWDRNYPKAQTYFKSTINESNFGSVFNSLKLYVNVHTVYYSVLACQTSPKNVNLLLKLNFVGLREKPRDIQFEISQFICPLD